MPPLLQGEGGLVLLAAKPAAREIGRRRGFSAIKLTPEEKTRLERLMAAEPAPDRPVQGPVKLFIYLRYSDASRDALITKV